MERTITAGTMARMAGNIAAALVGGGMSEASAEQVATRAVEVARAIVLELSVADGEVRAELAEAAARRS
jgi:hypothetical protein